MEGHPLQVPPEFLQQAKKMQSIRAVIVGSSTLCSKSFTHAYKSSASSSAVLQLEDMLPLEKFTPEHLQGHQRLVSVRQPTFTHANEASGVICCLHICRTLTCAQNKRNKVQSRNLKCIKKQNHCKQSNFSLLSNE